MTAALPALPDPAHDSSAATDKPGTLAQTAADPTLEWRILQSIEGLTRQTGRPPTYREVLANTGIRSHRRLSAGLDALVRAGRLSRLTGSRNLIVVRQPRAVGSD